MGVNMENDISGIMKDDYTGEVYRCPRCASIMHTVSEDQNARKRPLVGLIWRETPPKWGPKDARVSRTSYSYAYCDACGLPVALRIQMRYGTPARKG